MKEIESTNSLEGAEIFCLEDAEEPGLAAVLRNRPPGFDGSYPSEQIQGSGLHGSLSVVLGRPRNSEREDLLVTVLMECQARARAKLCSRLNVKFSSQDGSLDSIYMWAQIGLSLAKEQPEFAQPGRRRGRPNKPASETRPVRHAKLLDKMHEVARADGYYLSDIELAKLMKEEGIEEVAPSIETFLQQVSRGRKLIAN